MGKAASPERAAEKRRYLASILLVGSALTLAAAFALPFLHAHFQLTFPGWIPDVLGLHGRLRDWLISKAGLPEGDRYLAQMILGLFVDGEWFIGCLVAAFSVLFPAIKLILCAMLAKTSNGLNTIHRDRLLRSLHIVGPWSMADVFVVAVMISVYKSDALQFELDAGPGLWCYASSACLSYLALATLQEPWGGSYKGNSSSTQSAKNSGDQSTLPTEEHSDSQISIR